MSGSVLGGKRAAITNMSRYGLDYYVKLGQIGSKKGTTGGFYANRKLASEVGAVGGRVSKRRKNGSV